MNKHIYIYIYILAVNSKRNAGIDRYRNIPFQWPTEIVSSTLVDIAMGIEVSLAGGWDQSTGMTKLGNGGDEGFFFFFFFSLVIFFIVYWIVIRGHFTIPTLFLWV